MMHATPQRKLLTVMFTDIVGYTAMVRENEVTAREKRRRYRSILEEAHTQFDGRIVQYMGDGSLSIFESSLQALKCAINLQQQLRNSPIIDVRVGLHAGEVVLDTEGVFGDTVNIASRVESFSVSGAILMSEVVSQQVQNHPDIDLVRLGQFRLKNVDLPLVLYAARADNLVVPAPGELHGKGSVVGEISNLPRLQNDLLGRDREVEEIVNLIRKCSLVTLTGPGGTGKTSLALCVAQQLMYTFDDGVYWIAMSEITEKESVILGIAKALDLIQDPNIDTTDLVIQYLTDKSALIILDNFEQIVTAAPVIEKLINHCPHIRILVTSRIILNLIGEQEYPLAPLSVPVLDGDNTAQRLGTYASVDLFTQRARAVHPQFELNDQNAEDVARICIRLDGLPLAIELAAARIKLFSPRVLAQRLEQNLDILKSDRINRPARHQTLSHLISWSYDLLPPREKQLFHQLSVFSGGCTLDAIETICFADEDRFYALDTVLALVNKSLLHQMETDLGEPRFYLLKTIRTFALEALGKSDDGDNVRRAHVDYFLDKAERIQPKLTGPDANYWFSVLETDLDNYREAINWASDHELFGHAFRISAALHRLWSNRGMLSECVQLYSRLLAMDVPEAFRRERLLVLESLGVSYFYTNQYNSAEPIFRETLAFWKEVEDRNAIARSLNHLGFACGNIGKTSEGIILSQEALSMYKEDGDLRGQALSYNNLGWIHIAIGQSSVALENFEKSIELRKEINDVIGLGFQYINLVRLLGMLGRYQKAEAVFNRAMSMFHESNRVVITWAKVIRAFQLYDIKDFDGCQTLMSEVEKLWDNEGLHATGLRHYLNGLVASLEGEYDRSLELIDQGVLIFKQNGIQFQFARGLQLASQVAWQAGKDVLSLSYLKKSSSINLKYDQKIGLADNIEQAALIAHDRGASDLALQLIFKSQQLRDETGVPVTPVRKEVIDTVWNEMKEATSKDALHTLESEGLSRTVEDLLDAALQ